LIGELIAALAELGPTGTFSNGPVWHDYLADGLGLPRAEPSLRGGNNYAIGGAETDTGGVLEGFLAEILLGQQTGLAAQIDVFLAGLPLAGADPDALYIVWGGGNDMRGAADPSEAFPAVDNLIEHLRGLTDAGAQHFLVPNLPNLGAIPESIAAGSDAVALAESVTITFNDYLAASLDTFVAERTIDLVQFDVFAAFAEAIANPAEFGFTNVTDPCPHPDSACVGYVFWDAIHPTTYAHELLGERALTLLQPVVLGDLNDDGLVNGLDIDLFAAHVATGTFSARADIDGDGEVNGLDVDPFVALLLGRAVHVAAVPEPSTALLGLIAICLAGTWRRGVSRKQPVSARQSPVGAPAR
jgi:phospholipase/lecithinase/hemolysin